jgi:hypothetical protein
VTDYDRDLILALALARLGIAERFEEVLDCSAAPEPHMKRYRVRVALPNEEYAVTFVEDEEIATATSALSVLTAAVAQPVTAPTVDGTTITRDVASR